MTITHNHIPPVLAVTRRCTVQSRAEIHRGLKQISRTIPSGSIAGPPFCIFHFISSVTSGYDVTLGIPVHGESVTGHSVETLADMEVLSLVHKGTPETLGETTGKLFSHAGRHAIISDEFYREVYLDEMHSGGPGIKVQFVVHNWTDKLAEAVTDVLGAAVWDELLQVSDPPDIDAKPDERFRWVKAMLERLSGMADEFETYDILSRCAHVFPQYQVDKLAAVFREARTHTGDSLQAVDSVMAFMNQNPAWSESGIRTGHIIRTAKKPRDSVAYETAQTDLERRRAYCFCPLVRNNMDQGMPVEFCYCGAGWFRRQWEGAIGRPVTIKIEKSILRGDDRCEFAIQLPEDL